MKKALPWMLPWGRSLLFIFGGWIFVMITGLGYSDAMKWWAPLCTIYNLITILLLFFVCRFEKIEFSSLYSQNQEKLLFKNTFLFTLTMLSIGVGGMLTFSFLFYKELPEFLVQPIPLWIAIPNLILLPLTIVFAELPLYFGYSLNRIKKQTGKPLLAIIYIVFFYALQHSFIPLLWDFKYMLFRFLSFIPLMFYLGFSYHKKNNIKEMMIGHGVMDLSTSMQILIMSIL